MKTKLILLTVLGLLLLPAFASATHFTDLTGLGDCAGWSAMATVQWRYGVTEGTMDYTVSLLDVDNNVLETFTWEGAVTRDDSADQVFEYFDMWTVEADAGSYTVVGHFHLVSPYSGGVDESSMDFEFNFTCDTVSAEAHTWSAVKDLYR